MAIQVKNSSAWVTPSQIHAKSAGVWYECGQVWIRQGGTWYQMLKDLEITANTIDYNLFTALGSPTTPITARIEIASGVTISSSSSSAKAFTISGFATGSIIYLINNGAIAGAGGAGGARVAGTGPAATFGIDGGTALYTRNTLKLTNNGSIAAGGGGGGGGGRTNRVGAAYDAYTGVGGGGAGNIVGAGGAGIGICSDGNDGNSTLGGGAKGHCSAFGSSEDQTGSFGGAGGALGVAGNRGTPSPDFDGTNFGGAAGNAIDGISYTTKLTAGSILGLEVN
jgi:hypothetical protein|tara:strand:+ start:187 stop:1029 length:843 start_codon:yes stop_codon:yes gene_type:complete